jgi:hypothetical protein
MNEMFATDFTLAEHVRNSLMSTVYMWRQSDPSNPGLGMVSCPSCEGELTLHQPDPQLADRLLATCDECISWFLTNSEGVILTRLPEFPDNSALR